MLATVWYLRGVWFKFFLADNRATVHLSASNDKRVGYRCPTLLRLLANQCLKMRDRENLCNKFGFRRAGHGKDAAIGLCPFQHMRKATSLKLVRTSRVEMTSCAATSASKRSQRALKISG